MQSPVEREHAGIADDQAIMKSIALGWPDETFPAMRWYRIDQPWPDLDIQLSPWANGDVPSVVDAFIVDCAFRWISMPWCRSGQSEWSAGWLRYWPPTWLAIRG
jgi:hypothetical protein